jgi:hypothetical protein
MADVNRGADLATEIAGVLNDIILTTGEAIARDNKVIWEGYLHRYSNQDWDDMLTAMEGISELTPGIFKPYHLDAMCQARLAVAHASPGQARVLDHARHKRKAWSMIMAIREVINKFNGVEIPNRSQPIKRRSQSTFNDLFN